MPDEILSWACSPKSLYDFKSAPQPHRWGPLRNYLSGSTQKANLGPGSLSFCKQSFMDQKRVGSRVSWYLGRNWGGHFHSTWHSMDFVPILMELQKYLRGIPLRSNWSAVIMYSQSFSHCGWPPLALPGLSGSYLWVLFLHLPVSWKRQHSNGLKCFS